MQLALPCMASLTLGRHLLNRYDPSGKNADRPLFQRFFTNTLTDNGIPAICFWVDRIVTIADPVFLTPQGLIMVPLLMGTAQIIETGRFIAAFAVSKIIPYPVGTDISGFIGPRDFHARSAKIATDGLW